LNHTSAHSRYGLPSQIAEKIVTQNDLNCHE
jgi:hypothetical protein